MNYNWSNTTRATSGTGPAYPTGVDVSVESFIFKFSAIYFINKMELGSLVVLLSIFAKLFGFQIFLKNEKN
jgi:hypothetical protein